MRRGSTLCRKDTTHKLGFDFHVYPGEIVPLLKLFNSFDKSNFTEQELETLFELIDQFKDQSLNS